MEGVPRKDAPPRCRRVRPCCCLLFAACVFLVWPLLLATRAQAGQARATMQVGIRIIDMRPPPAGRQLRRNPPPRRAASRATSRALRRAAVRSPRRVAAAPRFIRTRARAGGGRCLRVRHVGDRLRRWFCFLPEHFR